MKNQTSPQLDDQNCLPARHFFICPDGDLHPVKPVDSIWIEPIGHWWNRKYRVHLQYKGAGSHDWEWDKRTRVEAVNVRDCLISILCKDQTT